MILLNDDEIPYKPDGHNEEFYGDIGARDKSIYLEGANAAVKKIVEYLDRVSFTSDTASENCRKTYRVMTIDVWKSLKKEAGI